MKNILWLFISITAIIIGYYFLEILSLTDTVLGENFYVISGCLLIGLGIISFFLAFKTIFFKKKKKKGKKSKVVFMDKKMGTNNNF